MTQALRRQWTHTQLHLNLRYLSRHKMAQLTWLFITRVSHHEWFIRFTSRSLLTPTIPGSYSSKRFQPQEFPNVVIPNTISTVFLATGSGLYGQRTIGAIILSSLYYMDIVPSTNVPIDPISPSEAPDLTTKIRDLSKQLSDTLTAATASGEINETWRMVDRMSFHDAIQILQMEANFPSE